MRLTPEARRVLMTIGRMGPLSRSAVARRLSFTPSRVTRMTESLLQAALIEETGFEASTGGRRGTLLTLAADPLAVVGVRISIAGDVDLLLMNLQAKALGRTTFATSPDTAPEALTADIAARIKTLAAEAGVARDRILGIGLGCSGLVDPAGGRVLRIRAFPQRRDLPLAALLREAAGLPVFLENEVVMSTLAELWFGNGKGRRHFLYVNLGRGIRMGMVIDGRLYSGRGGNAGELGHTTYRENGPICYCGNTGCLERYVSTEELVTWGREALAGMSDSRMAALCGHRPEDLQLAHILEAAAAQDRLATALVRRVVGPIGHTLAGLVNIFEPERILLAGGLVGGGDLLPSLLREQVRVHALPSLGAGTVIERAAFQPHGTSVGGGALVLEKLCAGAVALPGR